MNSVHLKWEQSIESIAAKKLPVKWSWEAVVQRCSFKKVLFEIPQNSQENTSAAPATVLKKRLWHRFFPLKFAKILRVSFFIEHLRWLLIGLTWRCFKISEGSDVGFLNAMFFILASLWPLCLARYCGFPITLTDKYAMRTNVLHWKELFCPNVYEIQINSVDY